MSNSQAVISPSARSSTSTSSTVQQVFEFVWNEYAAWRAEDCLEALKRLSRRVCRSQLPPFSPSTLLSKKSVTDDQLFRVEEYDADGTQVDVYTLPGEGESKAWSTIQPFPAYESCAPISRNVMIGDDSDYLSFLPFSDDPAYSFEDDNELHNFFSWHKRYLPPEIQVVVFETCQDLLSRHRMSPADIDNTKILPLTVAQILELQAQREFPKWRVPQECRQVIRKKETSPRETLQYLLERFCNSLNCVTPFCSTHLKTRPPAPVPPKLGPSKLEDRAITPCGKDCFMSPGDPIGTIWVPKETEKLYMTLDFAPDSQSCDLAIICRKPCREVHRQRKSYRSPAPPERIKHALPTSVKIDLLDANRQRMATRLPCFHQGPCDAKSQCACFLTRAPCRTRCGCSKTCARRWKGCTCARSAKVCGTRKCSCFRAFMECDPELCDHCEAKDPNSDLCKNVSIQRGLSKHCEVREGQWGLGLYVLEPCSKHDFIAEYVGELIFNPTVRSRSSVSGYRERSYIFDLNRRIAIDASRAGNETRYINHSENANCDTAVYLVNGEHRIGIYAARAIQEGEELFIDYGEKFFKGALVE